MDWVIVGTVGLAACGFWIYAFVNFRDEQEHPKSKHSFGSGPALIRVNKSHSCHVIVLPRPVVPGKRAKTA
jgi:hypothetical protein